MYPHRANHDSNARTRPLAYSEYCKDQPGRQQRALTTQQPRPATGTVLCGVPSLRQGDRPYREEHLVIAREYVGDFSQQDRSLRHRHGGRARSVHVGSSRTLGNQSQGIHNPDYDPERGDIGYISATQPDVHTQLTPEPQMERDASNQGPPNIESKEISRRQWELQKQLGVGSSSLVFEERYPDPKTGSRTVAVKRIYKKPRGIRIKEVELFVREVENFAWMSQFSEFVDFEGWHEDDDYLYIVMEHVKLGSLSKHCPPPPFHPETVQDIAIQLCKGLRVMHSCGIAHRDLNPNVCRPQMRWWYDQNILICSWEPTIEIKIADFGVSKLASSENNTQFRTNVGTEWYKAPEIFLSTQPYTTNVDLWSLGCVLYWMGEARTPFTDYNELFQYYHKGAMPSWSFRGTRTPLAVVMEGLLRAKPENRITTEEALSALLSEAEYTL